MIIIAGHLQVEPAERDAYVERSIEVVAAARSAPGCLGFSITADTVEAGCVRIFERWDTEEHLLAFRGAGPDDEQQEVIINAHVKRYGISSVGDP